MEIKKGYSIVEIPLCKFNGCDVMARIEAKYPEEASVKLHAVKEWFDKLVLNWNRDFYAYMKESELKKQEDHEWEQLMVSIKTDNVAHHTVALIQMADMIKKLIKEKKDEQDN